MLLSRQCGVCCPGLAAYFKGDKVNVSKKEIEKTLEKLSQELL